jgi:pimeloyl-ACP methyl ester carboxylesterase
MKTQLLLALLAVSIPGNVDARTTIHGDLPRKAEFTPEETPGLDTSYEVVRAANGSRLRAILTRPSGTTAKLPAIFLTQWVSCNSIEFRPTGNNEVRQLARQSGMVVIRVERAGTGDSEGPGCDKLDYDTEVADYRAAFDQLSRHAWVDADRIVIFGSSLGSTTAPLVAQGRKVAGVVVQGAGAVTYLERMIGFDRLNLERSGKYPVDQISREMVRRIRFQTHYLLEKKTPEQVVAEYPDLVGVWESLLGTDAKPHYGRPHAWHWQAADKDFLGAWANIEAPVMVVFGEYEQFETRHGHRLIVDTLNGLRPGSATWLELPKTGHDLSAYPDEKAAYSFAGGTSREDVFVAAVVEWLKKVTALTG